MGHNAEEIKHKYKEDNATVENKMEKELNIWAV
jgi:hypothetical protein